MMFNVDRPQKVGSPCAIYQQPHSKTSASRSSKPAVYEHMTETAPSCKTYLPTTRLHNTSQETPNPSTQPLRHPTGNSRNGVRPTLPTIINHSSVHSSAASPLPPAPASRLGCLPACRRTRGGHHTTTGSPHGAPGCPTEPHLGSRGGTARSREIFPTACHVPAY